MISRVKPDPVEHDQCENLSDSMLTRTRLVCRSDTVALDFHFSNILYCLRIVIGVSLMKNTDRLYEGNSRLNLYLSICFDFCLSD